MRPSRTGVIHCMIAFSFFVSVSAPAGFCTTVVVLRSDTSIVIAADSRIDFVGNNSQSGLICKIHRSEGLFWASDGYYKESQGFDLPALVLTADRTTPGKLHAKMAAFERIAESPILLEFDRLREYKPEFFSKAVARGDLFELMFARVDTVPNYVSVTYFIRCWLWSRCRCESQRDSPLSEELREIRREAHRTVLWPD
jgi:hypothetical protein